jgi:tRNA modification GTPase
MFSTDDTIVATATPPGRGGIAVVRLSGPSSALIASALTGRSGFEPRHATLTTVSAADGSPIDRAVVTFFPAPHSYTGDEVIEISTHGSPVVANAVVGAALARGARLATRGEFTFRAFLNGRIDLVQAEAIGDLVDAVTPLQARVAFDQLDGTLTSRLLEMDAGLLELIAPLEASLDFPDEGYHFIAQDNAARGIAAALQSLDRLLADARRGRMIREGLTAAIIGRPNAGKSSLFNRLAGASRAIVTEIPGTTRDLLTERIDIGGLACTLVDTAGLHTAAADPVEAEGIARARKAVETADLVLLVLDRSRPIEDADRVLLHSIGETRRIAVASKSDLPAAWDASAIGAVEASSLTHDGIERLRERIVEFAGVSELPESAPVANQRHVALLEKAREALSRSAAAALEGTPEEFVLADLYEARMRFDEVTGVRPQDEVLAVIFERFCIGK